MENRLGTRCRAIACLVVFVVVLSCAAVLAAGSGAVPVASPGVAGRSGAVAAAGNGMIAYTLRLHGVAPEIWVMNPDGSGARSLRVVGQFPAWSPDGNRIAFEAGTNVFVMNADGSGVRQLTLTGGYVWPTWSPDGARIATARGTAIWVMNAGGTPNPRLLFETAFPMDDVGWGSTPAGSRIVYSGGERGGAYGVMFMFDPGSPPKDRAGVTQIGPNQYSPAWGGAVFQGQAYPMGPAGLSWSPDGSRLAFGGVICTTVRTVEGAQQCPGQLDIWVVRPGQGDGAPRNVSRTDALPLRQMESWPAWSPDGTKIAFTSFPAVADAFGAGVGQASPRIFVMNAGGGGVRQLSKLQKRDADVNSPNRDEAPAWQPCISGVTKTCRTGATAPR
jgi:Tol biopolymer transport system component